MVPATTEVSAMTSVDHSKVLTRRRRSTMKAVYLDRAWATSLNAATRRFKPKTATRTSPHRDEAELIEQPQVAVGIGIGRGEKLRPVEDRVGASKKAQRLRLLAHVLAAGREPHHRPRHGDACDRDRAHELERIKACAKARVTRKRRAFDLDQPVDRHRFRMCRQIGELGDHADAVLARLAHADDAAAAHVNARVAHVAERIKSLLVSARRDDLAVELGRRIKVVIVVVEASRLELLRLLGGEHAEGCAGLEPERTHTLDHRADLVEVTLLRLAPSRTHAEAARTRGACRACLLQ